MDLAAGGVEGCGDAERDLEPLRRHDAGGDIGDCHVGSATTVDRRERQRRYGGLERDRGRGQEQVGAVRDAGDQ